MGKYKVSFDLWGLLLFLLVMIPNLIWFAVPAPHDILRAGSVTGFVDGIASVAQVLFVAALCGLVNQERGALRLSPLIGGCTGCVLLYYGGWILYYCGITHGFVILLLTVPPCLAFFLFAVDRKNFVAVIPAAIFAVCHVIYGAANFIMH